MIGIAGVFAGVGNYLFLAWFLGLSAVQEEADERLFSEISRRIPASGQLGVTGIGMEIGSVLMLAYAFSTETPEPGTGLVIAVGAALVVYLAGSTIVDL